MIEEQITQAEQYDTGAYECDKELSDAEGSLEALVGVVAENELDQVKLTEHQQRTVTAFKNLQKDSKDEVYAVVDKAALEGFGDFTNALVKRGCVTYAAGLRVKFHHASKTLNHYASVAATLKTRLEALRPLLKAREFPLREVFEYGAYSRFFTVAGKPISVYSQFQSVLDNQVLATGHVFSGIERYTDVIVKKLLDELVLLQSEAKATPERMVALRDDLERYWLQTWKEAHITPNPGQPPQSALQAVPEAKFTSLCPLFDNRYLVAQQPKNNGGTNSSQIASAMKFYGASIVFDKTKSPERSSFINIPNCDDLLATVDQCITQLNDFKALGSLAKKNLTYANDLKRAADILIKALDGNTSQPYRSFMIDYFKVLATLGNTVQEPYISTAWMFVRTVMIVTTLVELSVLEDDKEHAVAKRFMTKQNEEFAHVANESYSNTVNVLNAARGALVNK